jgi:hypothetical protein
MSAIIPWSLSLLHVQSVPEPPQSPKPINHVVFDVADGRLKRWIRELKESDTDWFDSRFKRPDVNCFSKICVRGMK